MNDAPMLALIALLATSSAGMAAGTDGTTKVTENFVKNATVSGKFEIESSRVALEKSQNAEVKEFAQTMIDDHIRADQELKSTIPQSSASMVALPEGLDNKHQKMLDKLQNASANDFDDEYIKAQKAAHKEAVSLFSSYAKKGDDAALKDFAGKTLPVLEAHQEHVKHLDGMM